MRTIGVIGGSGLTQFDELQIKQQYSCETPWGEPSSLLAVGSIAGLFASDMLDAEAGDTEIVFIARHGEAHKIPPHQVNYRANIAAMKMHGVTAIYAVNVVGALNRSMSAGDIVVPDQLIDYTWGREHTYSDVNYLSDLNAVSDMKVGDSRHGLPGLDRDPSALQHIDFTDPYDETLRQHLIKAAEDLGLSVHTTGVYVATQGPRLETAAEIRRMANDGCDIVGMTGMPEAALARELAIPYASLSLVVNMAAGLTDGQISIAEIYQVLEQQMVKIRQLLMTAAVRTTY